MYLSFSPGNIWGSRLEGEVGREKERDVWVESWGETPQDKEGDSGHSWPRWAGGGGIPRPGLSQDAAGEGEADH